MKLIFDHDLVLSREKITKDVSPFVRAKTQLIREHSELMRQNNSLFLQMNQLCLNLQKLVARFLDLAKSVPVANVYYEESKALLNVYRFDWNTVYPSLDKECISLKQADDLIHDIDAYLDIDVETILSEQQIKTLFRVQKAMIPKKTHTPQQKLDIQGEINKKITAVNADLSIRLKAFQTDFLRLYNEFETCSSLLKKSAHRLRLFKKWANDSIDISGYVLEPDREAMLSRHRIEKKKLKCLEDYIINVVVDDESSAHSKKKTKHSFDRTSSSQEKLERAHHLERELFLLNQGELECDSLFEEEFIDEKDELCIVNTDLDLSDVDDLFSMFAEDADSLSSKSVLLKQVP